MAVFSYLITKYNQHLKTSFVKIGIWLFSIAILFSACSRKKNSFVSRNYHAVTAEYNALYNGYLALEEGKKTLNTAYQDDYWQILPVERMQVFEDVILPGQSKNENFNRAEDKAIIAIQKHSMSISGKEYNPQMDEAYLLLGQSRYFDQRFVPALQAFNYILYRYPASDKINQAKIWREKTNIRLDNDELAIENLKKLLEEDIQGQDLADATSMLAQAYINTKSLDSAVTQLETASNSTKDDDERGRYRFIQGQLYNELGYKDSANIAFDQVIELNRRTPRIYYISAHLEKAKNFDYDNGDKVAFLELLTKLEENRENRPYLDRIYHQKGEFFLTEGMDSLALVYYNKSLRTPTRDKKLRARNYVILGDYYFDEAEYKTAGLYYDSTMLNMEKNKKPYRIIKRKRDNLEDVILYEDIAEANDSILGLVAMNDTERLEYFTQYTEDLKVKAEEEKERQEAAERMANQGLVTVNDNLVNKTNRGPNPQSASSFYFYNQNTISFGKNEFRQVWGDRAPEDNWRWSSNQLRTSNTEEIEEEVATIDETEMFDPNYYIGQIPVEQTAIDSIAKERNFAYYQLGIIYKEKFKEYRLSENRLEALLVSDPEEKLILPSKYNLYRVYLELGETAKAERIKQEIISEYPDSRYAAILINPESATQKDENSPESIYERLYQELQDQNYAEVLGKSSEMITQLEGDPMAPKFEILKATAEGRLYGFEKYSKGINDVAVNYSNTPEGIEAQRMVTEVLPKLAVKDFAENANETNFKIVYYFNNADSETLEAFKKKLDKEVEQVNVFELSTSIDIYNPNTTFVVVHGLKSREGAKGFALALEERKKDKIVHQFFPVSSSNYKIIQIHKNMDDYLNYLETNN